MKNNVEVPDLGRGNLVFNNARDAYVENVSITNVFNGDKKGSDGCGFRDIKDVVTDIRKKHFLSLEKQPILLSALAYYVELDVGEKGKGAISEERKSFGGIARDFCGNTGAYKNLPLLLLTGNSGAGKSVSVNWLVNQMWDQWEVDNSEGIKRVPLLIKMSSVEIKKDKKNLGNFFTKYLKKKLGLSVSDIQSLKKKPLLIVFDGYDEMQGEMYNLYQKNNLQEWDAKIIVTCRTQYLRNHIDYKHFFSLKDSFQCVKLCLSPLTREQVERFVDHYSMKEEQGKCTSEVIANALSPQFLATHLIKEQVKVASALPAVQVGLMAIGSYVMNRVMGASTAPIGLADQVMTDRKPRVQIDGSYEISTLTSNPLLLKLMIDCSLEKEVFTGFSSEFFKSPVTPSIVIHKRIMYFSGSMTRSDFYRLFLNKWFERESQRLLELTGQTRIKLWDFNLMPHQKAYIKFCQILSWKMLENKATSVKYENNVDAGSHHEDANFWSQFFGDEDERVKNIRMGSPLLCDNGNYSFFHQSFQEYFAALLLFQELFSDESLKKNFEALRNGLLQGRFRINAVSLKNNPEIIAYIAQMIKADAPKIDCLLYIISCSRKSELGKAASVAASNSMMILNAAFFNFSGCDFSGCDLSGTDLRGAYCDRTNFEGANLSNVLFEKAWLHAANFKYANLTGVSFDENPYITLSNQPAQLKYCSRHQTIVYSYGNFISFVNVITGETELTRNIHENHISCISITPDLAFVVFGSVDGSVKRWDIKNNSLKVIVKEECPITAITIDSTGNLIVYGTATCGLVLYRCDKDQKIQTNSVELVKDLRMSTNNNYIFFAGANKSIRIWKYNELKKTTLIGHQNDEVTRVDISKDGSVAISCGYDKAIYVWDLKKLVLARKIQGHAQWIQSASLSGDGRMVVSSSSDGTIRLWKVDTGEMLAFFPNYNALIYVELSEESDSLIVLFDKVRVKRIDYSPDKTKLWWNQNVPSDQSKDMPYALKTTSQSNLMSLRPWNIPDSESGIVTRYYLGVQQKWKKVDEDANKWMLEHSEVYGNNILMLDDAEMRGAHDVSDKNIELFKQHGINTDELKKSDSSLHLEVARRSSPIHSKSELKGESETSKEEDVDFSGEVHDSADEGNLGTCKIQ